MRNHRNAYLVSGLGALILFAAFIMYNTNPVPVWSWVKLSDLLTILGGLLFIIPFYQISVYSKTRDHAPHPFVWQVLPVIGMFIMIVGLLIPNDFLSWGAIDLADICYFVGAVLMLLIFVYPLDSVNEALIQEDVDDQMDDKPRA